MNMNIIYQHPSVFQIENLEHRSREKVSSIIPAIFITRRSTMAESVYKVIELVGTSTESWERAATVAVERAAQSLRDLRVAEVVQLDMVIDEGKVTAFRAKIKVSFKYESSG